MTTDFIGAGWKFPLGVDATGDDGFGIEVSRHIRPTTFHALGNAVLSSPTLRAALARNRLQQALDTPGADRRELARLLTDRLAQHLPQEVHLVRQWLRDARAFRRDL